MEQSTLECSSSFVSLPCPTHAGVSLLFAVRVRVFAGDFGCSKGVVNIYKGIIVLKARGSEIVFTAK